MGLRQGACLADSSCDVVTTQNPKAPSSTARVMAIGFDTMFLTEGMEGNYGSANFNPSTHYSPLCSGKEWKENYGSANVNPIRT
jgi:hypothetical protein